MTQFDRFIQAMIQKNDFASFLYAQFGQGEEYRGRRTTGRIRFMWRSLLATSTVDAPPPLDSRAENGLVQLFFSKKET